MSMFSIKIYRKKISNDIMGLGELWQFEIKYCLTNNNKRLN
jgi:hypothetical protein